MTRRLITSGGKKQEDELIIEERFDLKEYDVFYDFDDEALEYTDLDSEESISSYIISKELINAVNAAIITGRPLLLKGEPGCGKTKLAKAVAVHFHGNEVNKFFFEWFIKSKSDARKGCYSFDHVSRLRDATISTKDLEAKERIARPQEYIRLGAIGKAFAASPPDGKPAILLIDEIDKGGIDFPNDLLLELDEMRFAIPEMSNLHIRANKEWPPLVIITSNDERELPAAFLRRCLYFYISPFDVELLSKISKNKLKELYATLGIEKSPLDKSDNIQLVVDEFQRIRHNTLNNKAPSTSELLDWLKLITYELSLGKVPLSEVLKDEELQRLALKLM